MTENVELELIKKLKDAKEKYEALDEQTKTAKAEFERIYKELHFYLISNQKDATSEYKGLGKVRVADSEIIASVTKENEEQFYNFLHDVGREDLVRATVPWRSLSAFVKELKEEGKDIPQFINVYEKPKLRMLFKKGE